MATGIVSIGADDFGAHSISVPLLAAAAAGFVVLCLLFVVRMWRFPEEIWADTARPERAFGFFTFVADCNVLGVRLHAAGWSEWPTAWLWPPGWRGCYWPAARAAALAAVSLWAFGALLYLLLMGIILARLVLAPLDRVQPSPLYWISIGRHRHHGASKRRPAPAAQGPAVAGRLAIDRRRPDALPVGFRDLVIPLPDEACRAGLRADAVEHGLPLGMYAVATHAFGRAAGLPLLPGIARTEFWLALAAWAAVAAWMVISWFAPRWPSGPEPSAAVASGG